MTILEDVRQKYPQYKDVPDGELATALYKKYYSGSMTRDEFDQKTGVSSEKANTGFFRTMLDQATQGATLGFGDELQDVLASGLISGYYNLTDKKNDPSFDFKNLLSEGRRISERDIKSQQKERPVLSGVSQVGGGLALAASTPLSRFAGGTLGERVAKGSALGAFTGGTYGAGTGATPEERISGAGEGFVGGGIIGGAIPLGTELIKRGVNYASNVLNKPKPLGGTKAEKELVKSYMHRPDIEDIAKSSSKALQESKKSGVPITSAEALNDEGLMRELGVMREDPKVMGAVQKFFQAREEKLIPKALEDLQQGIAPVSIDEANAAVIKSAQDVKTKLIEKAREQAAPLYSKAFSVKDITSKKIDKILRTPAGKKALGFARNKMQNDMSLMAVPDKELGEIARDLSSMGKLKSPSGGVGKGLNLRSLDYVKRSFDDMIDTAKRSGENDNVRIFTNLKNTLLKELDDLSPDYKAARGIYSESMNEMDDILKGRFGRLMNLTEIQKEKATSELFKGTTGQTKKIVSQLSPEATKKGGAGELARVIESNKNSSLTVPNKIGFGSSKVKEQWKTVLGDKYSDFESMMKTLQRAERGTRSALGSPTQNKQAAAGRLAEAAGETVYDLAIGNRIGAIIKLRDFVKGAALKGADDKYLRDKVDLLMSDRGVKLVNEVADAMKKNGINSKAVEDKLINVEKYLNISSAEKAK